jgi:hypothetical protein
VTKVEGVPVEARERAAELARRGRERAQGYSWDATADATLASYERALAAHR